MKRTLLMILLATSSLVAIAKDKILLNEGWMARRASEVVVDGNTLSSSPLDTQGWMKATVPGTALTTLLDNGIFKAPEFSLNNELIPDIYDIGRDYYTFWYVKEFDTPQAGEKNVWLNFRGINYMADVFLNGKRLNATTMEGMFLRHSFNITPYLKEEGKNVLAVIVFPPVYPGNPNGGQGGDGMIARNCTMQYTPGWDWVQAVKDRNTGIWDEVSITFTGDVKIEHPYVVTKVPGVRKPSDKKQGDAVILSTVQLQNVSHNVVKGNLIFEIDGAKTVRSVILGAGETKEVVLPELKIKNPKLWWPNGIGDHPLYPVTFSFEAEGKISDQTAFNVGIREITSKKAENNGGRIFFVNGQKIYMTGGNYINSDWLLRLSPERYLDEVRFHAEMNVRMIRVWGGALLERPEFYDACDQEGILVFQDLWGSGDCNGAWIDPLKKESRERRWEYPDNHGLFIEMAEDQVKMIRNHPSLCLWCGANEWPLAKDINEKLRDDVFPRLDPNRLFASFSTDTVFTRNTMGGVGDGPYGIQEPEWFFTFHSSPFNPESGNVGSPEVETFREFMTEEDMAQFPKKHGISRAEVWRYHKDLGYGEQLNRYGEIKDIETYCRFAQVVNYDQYRSFMEGWASHMWDWYNGILIWKTQNPWPGLRGQMYDWYLDVNASLYGTAKGCEPLHPFYNLDTKKLQLLNSTVEDVSGLEIKAQIFNLEGKELWSKRCSTDAPANSVQEFFGIPQPEGVMGVYFIKITLFRGDNLLTDNIYWQTTVYRDYTTLRNLPKCKNFVKSSFTRIEDRIYGTVTLKSEGGVSFFNRIKLFDKETGKRILPVHYSDNYITLMPGDEKTVELDFPADAVQGEIEVRVENWN